jgi:hypothetical protein
MKAIFRILVLFLSITSFSQNFKGEIVYANTYKSKNPQVTNEQWNLMIGTTQRYLTQDGNYKSITNGKLLQWQLYINKDNKLYNKMSNSETIYWNDGSIQGDEIINIEINKNVEKILNLLCDEVILVCKSGVQKYYFNSSLSVEPNIFINHKFGNWYDFLLKSKSFPLKMIIENDQFIITSTATEIIPKDIENAVFNLPPNTKTEKSMY